MLLLVTALHAVLYDLLRGSGLLRSEPDRREALPTRITLRLLPWPEAAPARPTEATNLATAREARAKPKAAAVPKPISGTEGAPALTPIAIPNLPGLRADAAPPPMPPASQPPPLNLSLPRRFGEGPSARNPGLDDPRANTARMSPGERMAATLGADTRLIEEDLGGGRHRFRRGNECAIVTQSRIAQLLPFNDAAARSPSLVGSCP